MQPRKVVPLVLILVALLVAVAIWMVLSGDESGPAGEEPPTVDVTPAVDEAPETTPRKKPEITNRWIPKGPGSAVGIVREYGSDRPLADIGVSLSAGLPGPNETLRTKTGKDGSFRIEDAVNFDEWRLRVAAPKPLAELVMNGIEILTDEETDLGIIYVTPAFVVPGVVVDVYGEPIANATVRALRPRPKGTQTDFLRLIREMPQRAPSVDAATTDEKGVFELTQVPPGTYDIELAAPGFSQDTERTVVISPQAADRPLRFVMRRGFELAGRVVRANGGSAEGMKVIAFEDPQGEMELFKITKRFAVTDENGEFLLTGLSAGDFVLIALPEGEPATVDDEVSIPATDYVEIVIHGDAWLEGRVSDLADDHAITDAEVYVVSDDAGKPLVGRAVTDADGRYRIDGLKSGPTQIFLVQATGYGTYPDDVFRILRGGGASDLTIRPGGNVKDVQLGEGATVRGTVIDQTTNSPVEGVRVSLLSAMSFFGGSKGATTDATGNFEIRSVPKGMAVLTAEKEGWYQPGVTAMTVGMMAQRAMSGSGQQSDPGRGAQISVTEPGQVIERELKIAAGATIKGVVLTPDGEPLQGAQVVLESGDERGMLAMLANMMGSVDPRLSQAGGTFELPGPPPGTSARIVARAQGYLEGRSADVKVRPGEVLEGVEVRLRQGAVLAGTVRDAGGKPVRGALVRWTPMSDENEWQVRWKLRQADPATTGDDGRYRAANVEPGEVIVQVSHSQYLSIAKRNVKVEEGKSVSLEFDLTAGGRLTGVVLGPDGKPYPGARVDVSRESGWQSTEDPYANGPSDPTTNSDGTFEVEGLLPGKLRVFARASGLAPSPTLNVEADGAPLTLRLEPAFEISGVVRYEGGDPVPGAVVTAIRREGDEQNEVESEVSNNAGEFVLRDIPGGTYEIRVTSRNWGPARANVLPTTVKDVQAGQQGLVVEVPRGLTITGTLVLANGELASEGWISGYLILEPGSEGTENHNTWAQVEAGRFELIGLRAGKYNVTANSSDQAQRTMAIDAGTEDVRIQLGTGARVSGRVTMPDGSPAKNVNVWANAEDRGSQGTTTNEDGTYTIAGLEGATYTVHVWASVDGETYTGSVEGVVTREGDEVVGIDIVAAEQMASGE